MRGQRNVTQRKAALLSNPAAKRGRVPCAPPRAEGSPDGTSCTLMRGAHVLCAPPSRPGTSARSGARFFATGRKPKPKQKQKQKHPKLTRQLFLPVWACRPGWKSQVQTVMDGRLSPAAPGRRIGACPAATGASARDLSRIASIRDRQANRARRGLQGGRRAAAPLLAIKAKTQVRYKVPSSQRNSENTKHLFPTKRDEPFLFITPQSSPACAAASPRRAVRRSRRPCCRAGVPGRWSRESRRSRPHCPAHT